MFWIQVVPCVWHLPVQSIESHFVYLGLIKSFSLIVFVLYLSSVLFGMCKSAIFINTVRVCCV